LAIDLEMPVYRQVEVMSNELGVFYPTKVEYYRPSLLRSSGGRARLRGKWIFFEL